MKKIISISAAMCFIIVFSLHAVAGDMNYSTNPTHASSQSKKWRIGYLQGGDYIDYKQTLLATVEGLVELGWILPFDIQKYTELDTEAIWKILAEEAESDYLSFVKEAFYDAKWKNDLRKTVADELSQRIQKKKDVDLLIAMRTWAGQDISKRSLDTNIFVMSSSDPVASGIIKSPYKSGIKNLYAPIDPTFHERQIRYFHDAINFKKLGIIFENSVAGTSYAGFASVERLSKEIGFELLSCFAISDTADVAQCQKEYLECIDKISSKIDALYVTVHGGVTDNSLPIIVEKSNFYGIPTFSQSGHLEVEKGLLMSLSRFNFKKIGLFQAAIISNIFNGAKPGDLVQTFEERLSMSLNLDTARKIGYIPTADVIAAADIMFHNSSKQKQ